MSLHTTLRRASLFRAVLLAGFLLVGLASVQVSASPGIVPQVDMGGAGGASGNEGAAYRLFHDVFGGNAASSADLVTDGALIHTPSGEFVGAAGLNEFVASMRAPFTDATFTVNDLATDGNTMLVRWTMRGIITAGAPIVLDGMAVLQFENGMIAESWMSYDRMALTQQIEAASYTSMENARSQTLPVLGAVEAPQDEPVTRPDPRTPD